MTSIVIPAHNESSVIGHLLEALLADSIPGEFNITVVCNGCDDNTAEVARRYSPAVRVVELAIASKTEALNCGDRTTTGFPRFYVDADVVVTGGTVRSLADRLDKGDVLAVAPRAQFHTEDSSLAVRLYFDIRNRLPSANEGIGGSGVYGLSKSGRQRFGEFPRITADDGYVRIHFTDQERETVHAAYSVVFAPRRIRDLIAIKSRSYLGNYELAKRYPDLWHNRGPRNDRALVWLLLKPWLWPGILIYGQVTLLAKQIAKVRIKKESYTWQRDTMSRAARQ